MCLTSAETTRLIRDGRRGERGYGGGENQREIIYLSLHCHHQNGFCIKVGSDESHFNVSLIVRDKVTRQSPQTTTFEVKGSEPKQIRTEVPYQPTALPLGQTGSLCRPAWDELLIGTRSALSLTDRMWSLRTLSPTINQTGS